LGSSSKGQFPVVSPLPAEPEGTEQVLTKIADHIASERMQLNQLWLLQSYGHLQES